MPIFLTSVDAGHRHLYEKDKKNTFRAKGHVHKIDLDKGLALAGRKGGHSHKLLKTRLKKR